MAHTSGNVRALTTSGAVYVAATSTTAPTSASSALTAAWGDLGGLDEDGVAFKPESKTEEIRYANGELARVIVTESKFTASFKLMEATRLGLETFYGATATASTSGLATPIDPGSTGGRKSWVFDVVDGTKIVRHYFPSAEVSDRDDNAWKSDEPSVFELEVTAYRDSTLGYSAIRYDSGLGETLAGNGASVWEADDEVITEAAHGLAVGDYVRVVITSGATGAVAGYYYVKTVPSSSTFTVSLTPGGTTQAVSADGVVEVYKQGT